MLARAFAAGVPADWVVGDTLYGYDELRLFLEEQHKHYVLAIPETHAGLGLLGSNSPSGTSRRSCQMKPRRCSRQEKAVKGRACTNGPGSSCLRGLSQARKHKSIVKSRRVSCWSGAISATRACRAYYRVAGPATLTLSEVVCIAGRRWTIEEGIEEAKGEVGLEKS
ncbi:MAG: hypothetical protein J2P36_20450 [Ktedonobacteraceae bacterium]|nr:hypothetical protein [Ktedonobacteraceae bacterium]